MLAGLPYVVWPIGSAFILASRKKDDPFLHYHAVQALLAGAVMLVLSIIAFVVMVVMFRVMPGTSTLVPGILGMAIMFGGGAIAMVVFFTALFLGWRATAGEMLRIPYLGDYAEEKMLDHTGMTRREFVSMLEESLIEPNPDDEAPIPFPGSQADRLRTQGRKVAGAPLSATPPSNASAAGRQDRSPSPGRPSTPTSPSPSRQAGLGRPLSDRSTSEPRPVSLVKESNVSRPTVSGPASPSREPSQNAPSPRVKDVDLIRHYKDRQSGAKPSKPQPPAAQTEVLRKWLSSVDRDT